MASLISEQNHDSQAVANGGIGLKIGWAFIGNIAYAGSQLGLIATLTRLSVAGVGPLEAVGSFSLYYALATPVFIFSQLQLRQLLLADCDLETPFYVYVRLRTYTAIVAVMFCSLLGPLCVGWEGLVGFYAVAIAKCCETIGDIFYGNLQRSGNNCRVAIMKGVKGVITLIAFAAALWLTHDLSKSLVVLAFVWLAYLFAVERRVTLGCEVVSIPGGAKVPHCEARYLGNLLARGLPLGLAAVLISFQTVIPRLAIDLYGTRLELGAFAIASQFCLAITVVTAAVSQVLSTRLSRMVKNNQKKEYIKAVRNTAFVGVFLSGVAISISMLAGRELVVMLFGVSIENQFTTLVILVISACVAAFSAFVALLLHANMESRRILWGNSSGMVVCLACAYALVPSFGAVGAAVSGAIANIAVLGTHFFALRKVAIGGGLAATCASMADPKRSTSESGVAA